MIWLVNNWRNLIIVGLIALSVTYSALFDHYRTKAKEQSERAVHAEEQAEARQKTITNMLARQRDVAALDDKYTKELADAKASIDELQSDVIAGRKRLQLNATCAKSGTASTGSVGDATSARLNDTAERDYFTLRERINTITGQVNYLQQYIREQCLK